MQLAFSVIGQELSVRQRLVVSGTHDYLEANFVFSGWEGLTKFAHFEQGENNYIFELQEDKITKNMHLDLGEGTWKVYVHGNNDTQRVTTNVVTIAVDCTGAIDGEPLPEMPLTVAEQIAAQADVAVAVAQSVRDDAVEGKFKGDKGDAGYTPIKGVDYWTAEDEQAIADARVATDAANTATLNAYEAIDVISVAKVAAETATKAADDAAASALNAKATVEATNDTMTSSEAARVDAEVKRESAEVLRQSTFDANENSRADEFSNFMATSKASAQAEVDKAAAATKAANEAKAAADSALEEAAITKATAEEAVENANSAAARAIEAAENIEVATPEETYNYIMGEAYLYDLGNSDVDTIATPEETVFYILSNY